MMIFLAVVLSGCGQSAENPDIIFERGNLAASSGEMETAVRQFTAALQSDPNRTDIVYERGRAYESLGLLDKAIEDYQACQDQEPNFEGAINNTGVCFAKLQNHKAAIEQFSKLIALSSQNVLALRNRGLCYHDTGQFKAAMADYDAALEIDSEDPETWFQRGNVFLEDDDNQKAFINFSEAVRIDPQFSKAWMNRGVALFGLNRQAEGMQDLVKASELDDNIIIPDLDWNNVSKNSKPSLTPQPANRQTTSTDKSSVVEQAIEAGWTQIQKDSTQLLLSKNFEAPTLQTAVPSQLCGILNTRKAGQKLSVYVGVSLYDSNRLQIPAAPAAPGAKRSLLVVKFDPKTAKFVEQQLIENWQPTAQDISAATVEAKLP
ncbi:MAG: tetratricopeptide repeat protein [Fuerstiella sp.]